MPAQDLRIVPERRSDCPSRFRILENSLPEESVRRPRHSGNWVRTNPAYGLTMFGGSVLALNTPDGTPLTMSLR